MFVNKSVAAMSHGSETYWINYRKSQMETSKASVRLILLCDWIFGFREILSGHMFRMCMHMCGCSCQLILDGNFRSPFMYHAIDNYFVSGRNSIKQTSYPIKIHKFVFKLSSSIHFALVLNANRTCWDVSLRKIAERRTLLVNGFHVHFRRNCPIIGGK